MSSASSSPTCIKDTLTSAYRASVAITASISGTSRSLLATLSEIPPLEPSAQALLDRARSILTSGPQLSMNVELADGEELPVAMHTLNQGAVWACLVGGGANPDLEDRVLEEAQDEEPHTTRMHDKIRKALAPEAKCLWFLCRKFFFTFNVAEKDGECYQHAWSYIFYHHRMYMGRLFMLDTDYHTALTRARMPRALEVYSDDLTRIARTPKGLWGWGDSGHGQLGFKSSKVDPTRLTFPACAEVAELEASLPPWEKHWMVTGVSLICDRTFILSSVGTVMAGGHPEWYVGPVVEENRPLFHPVAVPSGFVPDHIMHVGLINATTVILSMGDRQMISGGNYCGQLGLGHHSMMAGFEDLPYRVDRIMTSVDSVMSSVLSFNIFLSGRQLLFAGKVPIHVSNSGLLPGKRRDDKCLTPTPLRFPERVKGFWCDDYQIVWGTEGRSHLSDDYRQCTASVPIEATAYGTTSNVPCFRDSAGQWFEVADVSDVTCGVPGWSMEISPVDPAI
ncbi:hypothetical protein J8273_8580 [Carpediemonas membranifera]|uniref:Uncharacterized protein n=1 Tax=Carpediemonas membranifera TaxID=201153 RepID=A0A8J6APS8_9EUKA|nr:hypothetical protein J8273_8580 [Carpediemonas membranifera]|eukprot:KAG9389893.1 hypothetical protein J8273_8580 [Carpediemonas membranifera]